MWKLVAPPWQCTSPTVRLGTRVAVCAFTTSLLFRSSPCWLLPVPKNESLLVRLQVPDGRRAERGYKGGT